MSRRFVQNNYLAGDTVSAKSDPQVTLTIRRYIDQVYYCKLQADPEAKDVVYYERELVPQPELMAKNQQALITKNKKNS